MNPYAYIKNTLAEFEAIHKNHQLAELNISLELKHAGDPHEGEVWHRKVKVVQSDTSLQQRFLSLFTTGGS